MKIVFIGSKEIGLACLEELLKLKQEISLIISVENDLLVKNFAKHKKIKYLAPANLNNKKIESKLKNIKPDLMVVCGWSRLINQEIFSIPVKGTIALHGSLLPINRGFAPMTWPIINGEKETGMTLFYLNSGMDEGDIIGQIKYDIGSEETGQDLYLKAIQAVRKLILKYIPMIKKDTAPQTPQKKSGVSYAFARVPEDGVIDWTDSAKNIHNLVRALTKPFPGAFTYFKNQKLFIWKTHILKNNFKFFGNCGQVVKIIPDYGVWVLTGQGILVLEQVQLEGTKDTNAGNFFKSIKTKLGFDIIKEIIEIKNFLKR